MVRGSAGAFLLAGMACASFAEARVRLAGLSCAQESTSKDILSVERCAGAPPSPKAPVLCSAHGGLSIHDLIYCNFAAPVTEAGAESCEKPASVRLPGATPGPRTSRLEDMSMVSATAVNSNGPRSSPDSTPDNGSSAKSHGLPFFPSSRSGLDACRCAPDAADTGSELTALEVAPAAVAT